MSVLIWVSARGSTEVVYVAPDLVIVAVPSHDMCHTQYFAVAHGLGNIGKPIRMSLEDICKGLQCKL